VEKDISVDLLERPSWILTLLVYLHSKGPSNMSEIERDLGLSRQSLYGASKKLEELDFVFRKPERGFPTKVYLHLTRLGTESAELLSKVNTLVKETLEAYKNRLRDLNKEEITEDDTKEKSDLLCKLASLSFSQGRWNDAVKYGEECLSLAKELGSQENEAKSNWILGEVYFRRGEVGKAVNNLKRSHEIFKELGDWEHQSSIHYSFGAMAEREGDFQRALEEYEESEKCAKEVHYQTFEGRARLGVGRIFGRRGQYKESYRELMKALQILEKANAVEELPKAYANIGATTAFIDIDESIDWHEKSIEAARSVGDYRIAAYGWMNLAGCLMEKSEYPEALLNLEHAMEVAPELDDKQLLSSAYIQIGIAHREMEKWGKAREALGRAVDIAKAADLKYNRANAVFNLALLDVRTSKSDTARKRLMLAKEIFEELDNLDKVAEVEEALESISNQ
jgi:tetratricopeptide (TPR) repeat protein